MCTKQFDSDIRYEHLRQILINWTWYSSKHGKKTVNCKPLWSNLGECFWLLFLQLQCRRNVINQKQTSLDLEVGGGRSSFPLLFFFLKLVRLQYTVHLQYTIHSTLTVYNTSYTYSIQYTVHLQYTIHSTLTVYNSYKLQYLLPPTFSVHPSSPNLPLPNFPSQPSPSNVLHPNFPSQPSPSNLPRLPIYHKHVLETTILHAQNLRNIE